MTEPQNEPSNENHGSRQSLPIRDERQTLPSGRSIVVQAGADGEVIEVRSAAGATELRVILTEDGPVLSLTGVKLQIDSTDSISLNCAKFEVNTTESLAMRTEGDLDIQSDGEVRVKSAQSTYIDGDYVMLNCGDRDGYHDADDREGHHDQAALENDQSSPPAPPPTSPPVSPTSSAPDDAGG